MRASAWASSRLSKVASLAIGLPQSPPSTTILKTEPGIERSSVFVRPATCELTMSELDAYRKAHPGRERKRASTQGLGVLVLPDARETSARRYGGVFRWVLRRSRPAI